MIDSTINETEEKEEFKYPMLMKSTANGMIVLMVNEEGLGPKGIVLNQGNQVSWAIGEIGNAWDKTGFKPFTGSITLKNKE